MEITKRGTVIKVEGTQPKTGEKSPWGASLLGISLSGSIFVILRRKHKSQR